MDFHSKEFESLLIIILISFQEKSARRILNTLVLYKNFQAIMIRCSLMKLEEVV